MPDSYPPQPKGFLPIIPARTRHGFETIRSVRTGASGTPYVRSGGVSRWRGSFKLPLMTPKILLDDPNDPAVPNSLLERASGREVLCFFRERDNNSAFFFADLRTLDKTDEDPAVPNLPRWRLPNPEWHSIRITSPLYFEILDPPAGAEKDRAALLKEVDPGDIISFREVAPTEPEMQDYVTARVVIRKEGDRIYLDRPLPLGMAETHNTISKQACWNRPHVRALMTNPPALWESIHTYLDMPAVEWVEDLVEVSFEFRSAAGNAKYHNLATAAAPDLHDLGDGMLLVL